MQHETPNHDISNFAFAAIRTRALSNLAECLEVFRALLAASSGDDNDEDDDGQGSSRDVRNVAEGFLLALSGGHMLGMQVCKRLF